MRLGKHQLIRQLAIGGMAEVYLARARGIEGFTKRVVLKRILPQYAMSEDFVKMFLDEARLAATLDHPNVVHVYDIGQTVGNYYFTMEYVQGQDVRTILKTEHKAGRAVPWGCALAIARGIAAGLHYAHDKTDLDGQALGIVHRDVSLSNILVSYDGAVKLVDFGVAKCVARETETRAGTLKGKIAYMSPEQCRGEPLDRRSDIFALGIILYELTTGTRLFAGESEFATLQKIATEDVEPPSTRRADFPRELEDIILKALARDRDNRYASARDLQRDLEKFAREHRIDMSSLQLSDYMQQVFAEDIKAQPSDSGVGSASELARKAAELVGSEPRDDSVLIVDASEEDDQPHDGCPYPAASDGVHTAMFDGPLMQQLAAGTGEEAIIEVVPPTRVRSQSRWPARLALLAAAALVAGALIAMPALRDAPIAASPAPELPSLEPTAGVVNQVSATPAEQPVANPAPARTTPKKAAKARKRSRRSRAKPKQKAKPQPTWNPDSALPPPS